MKWFGAAITGLFSLAGIAGYALIGYTLFAVARWAPFRFWRFQDLRMVRSGFEVVGREEIECSICFGPAAE